MAKDAYESSHYGGWPCWHELPQQYDLSGPWAKANILWRRLIYEQKIPWCRRIPVPKSSLGIMSLFSHPKSKSLHPAKEIPATAAGHHFRRWATPPIGTEEGDDQDDQGLVEPMWLRWPHWGWQTCKMVRPSYKWVNKWFNHSCIYHDW